MYSFQTYVFFLLHTFLFILTFFVHYHHTLNMHWANAQYSRHACLEVVGIPSSVKIKHLEGKVCSVFKRIGVPVNPDDIEAYHRLYNDKKTIFKFSRRKLCQKVLREKKELKNVDPSEFDFSGRHSYIY